jgi:hypothetical protein
LSIVQRFESLFLIQIASRDSLGEVADHARGVAWSDSQAPAIFEWQAPAGKMVECLDVAV